MAAAIRAGKGFRDALQFERSSALSRTQKAITHHPSRGRRCPRVTQIGSTPGPCTMSHLQQALDRGLPRALFGSQALNRPTSESLPPSPRHRSRLTVIQVVTQVRTDDNSRGVDHTISRTRPPGWVTIAIQRRDEENSPRSIGGTAVPPPTRVQAGALHPQWTQAIQQPTDPVSRSIEPHTGPGVASRGGDPTPKPT